MSDERVVLVTGAASGISALICQRIEGPGARLLITGQTIQVDGGLTLA